MDEMEKDYNEAWKFLEEKGLTLGERIRVKTAFIRINAKENPFIGVKYKKGEIEYYHSTHSRISNLMFVTENEVVLANAIYLNMDSETFNPNDFIFNLKAVFRLLIIDSGWAK